MRRCSAKGAGWLLGLFAVLAAEAAWPDLSAPLHQLEVARDALRDEFWSLAAGRADKAAHADEDTPARRQARRIELEALARAGRIPEMLDKVEAWGAGAEEEDAFIRYWHAWALAEANRLPEARAVLEKPFDEEEIQVLACRLKARLAVAAGDAAEAELNFKAAARGLATNQAGRAENALAWARFKADQGRLDEALAVFAQERVLAVPGPEGDRVRLTAAVWLENTGRQAEADRLLRDLVAAGTRTEEGAYVQAACLVAERSKDPLTALDYARRAEARARQKPMRLRAGLLLGLLESARGAKAEREQGLARILTLAGTYAGADALPPALLALGDNLMKAGDAAAAEKVYRQLLESSTDLIVQGDGRLFEGLGRAQEAQGRPTEAIGSFARGAQVATNGALKVRLLCRQADLLVAEKRFAEAAPLYDRVANMGGETAPQARFNRADALARAGAAEEARAAFGELAAGKGLFADKATLRVASAQAAAGQLEQARETYDRLLKRNDLSADLRVKALVGRGRTCYRAYRAKEASADFSAAARLAPQRSDEMRFLSALCLYRDGREAEAKAEVVQLQAEVKDPTLYADLVLWLARYDANRGNWVAAQTGFEHYAALVTNRPAIVADAPVRVAHALVSAARAAYAQSDYAKTVDLVTAAAKECPKAPFLAEAYLVQGEALVMLARYDDAVLVIDTALAAAHPDEETQRRMGLLKADALFALGADDAVRYEEALKAYRTVAADRALTPSARLTVSFKIGRTLEKLHRRREAEEQYYENVVLAFDNARKRGDAWFDEAARSYFARAAFTLADGLSATGRSRQAGRVLKLVAVSGVPAAEEAKRRLERIKAKGEGR